MIIRTEAKEETKARISLREKSFIHTSMVESGELARQIKVLPFRFLICAKALYSEKLNLNNNSSSEKLSFAGVASICIFS